MGCSNRCEDCEQQEKLKLENEKLREIVEHVATDGAELTEELVQAAREVLGQ